MIVFNSFCSVKVSNQTILFTSAKARGVDTSWAFFIGIDTFYLLSRGFTALFFTTSQTSSFTLGYTFLEVIILTSSLSFLKIEFILNRSWIIGLILCCSSSEEVWGWLWQRLLSLQACSSVPAVPLLSQIALWFWFNNSSCLLWTVQVHLWQHLQLLLEWSKVVVAPQASNHHRWQSFWRVRRLSFFCCIVPKIADFGWFASVGYASPFRRPTISVLECW